MEQTFDIPENFSNNESQLLYSQTEEFLSSISSLDSIAVEIASKILELIFSQQNRKEKLSFFIELLKILKRKAKSVSQNIEKFLKDYLQKLPRSVLEDDKRFNDLIIMKFLNAKLILLIDLDEILAGVLSKNCLINVQNTIIKLLSSLILDQHVLDVQTMTVVPLLQEVLERKDPIAKDLANFLEELKKEKNNNFPNPNANFSNSKKEMVVNADVQNYINAVTLIFGEYDKQFYEIVVEKFDKWLLLSTEIQISSYIHDLESSFVSKLDENFKKFFVYVIDICVNRALDSL